MRSGSHRSETALNVAFVGPFALAGDGAPLIFGDAVSLRSGLYMWSVPYAGRGFIVMYVGETGIRFGQRMKEHVVQTLGGNYRVSAPDRLREGVDDVVWDGLWRAGTRDRLPELIERFREVAEISREMLLAVRVFVAPLGADVRLRRRIEAALARHVWSQPAPAWALLPRDIRFAGRRAGDNAIQVHVATAAPVLGFPAVLEA
jgi:hypothetical protein